MRHSLIYPIPTYLISYKKYTKSEHTNDHPFKTKDKSPHMYFNVFIFHINDNCSYHFNLVPTQNGRKKCVFVLRTLNSMSFYVSALQTIHKLKEEEFTNFLDRKRERLCYFKLNL